MEVMLSSERASLNIICNADGGTFELSDAVKTIIELKFKKACRLPNRVSQRTKASRLTRTLNRTYRQIYTAVRSRSRML